MNNLCKALIFAVGSVIVYTVATKVAEKICDRPTQDDIEDITEEVMDELEDEFDDEVVENVFYRIGKEIKNYMKQATNASKERLELCLNFVSDKTNRKFIGVGIMGLGGGIVILGASVLASAYIR